jgi:hypothetical protein
MERIYLTTKKEERDLVKPYGANDMTKDTTIESELCREAYKRHIEKSGIGGSTGGSAHTKPVEVKIATQPEAQQPVINNEELIKASDEFEDQLKAKVAEWERKKQEGIKAMEEKHGIKINQGREGIDRGGFDW